MFHWYAALASMQVKSTNAAREMMLCLLSASTTCSQLSISVSPVHTALHSNCGFYCAY